MVIVPAVSSFVVAIVGTTASSSAAVGAAYAVAVHWAGRAEYGIVYDVSARPGLLK